MPSRFTEVIETLRTGQRIPWDHVRRFEPFEGVYAWWANADSPPPIKPMIPPIKAGACLRVGGAGVLSGRNTDPHRLSKGIRSLPGILTCAGRESRWYTVFPDLATAEDWCRKTVYLTLWHRPEGWDASTTLAAEKAARNAIDRWVDRYIDYSVPVYRDWKDREKHLSELGPYCPKCRHPVPVSLTGVKPPGQNFFKVWPCERCGWSKT